MASYPKPSPLSIRRVSGRASRRCVLLCMTRTRASSTALILNAFCANTAIVYQGEPIAIWKVDGEPDISVLTAKIVHEMFHAYQIGQGWDCWADEMDALYRYEYDAENLALRLRENELLLSLAEHFDEGALRELLSHRKRRSEEHPYEFSYESEIEEIEGSAPQWRLDKHIGTPIVIDSIEAHKFASDHSDKLLKERK